ncbi:hypothetical protein ADL01_19515 [Streptomyces sp. NRRL WC-3618]|uniref:DUF6059 family protein n=1 Tax=Streptomyces sp. NRRL WC-3618 TaxID=1519490 RepID=UPI0006AF7443|nr:DUF6059 family protein [Streptomyces sp. NRRL WC-3618]KOV72413.1 hypothetical protein ADL01_19515 [Streptomyces sp. NRRL WC-3618]
MSGTNKELSALALATAKRLLRPVGRALVIYGWLWLPGPPPKDLFDWPEKEESPAAHPRRAQLEPLDWRRL